MPVDPAPSEKRVHVIGAGPVGLLLTALLQSMDGVSVSLFEKRREYTRTRMVRLAASLVSDSVASYRTDCDDGENVDAVFDPTELDESLAFRQSIPADLMALLREWALGFCPLNEIEHSLSDLIDNRQANPVRRTMEVVSAEDALAMLEPGDVLIDCSGSHAVMGDYLVPDLNTEIPGQNTQNIRLEYALVVTFLYGQQYNCNEYCKYFKNVENPNFKFIPSVQRTYYDGAISHVTGIISIKREIFEPMPSRFDGEWLRSNFPMSLNRWTGSSTRSKRKQTAKSSETCRLSGFRSICTGPAMQQVFTAVASMDILSRRNRFSCSVIQPSVHRISSRFRSVSNVRCIWPVSSNNPICRSKR